MATISQQPPAGPLAGAFSHEELARILDEALVYQCACPAQVAELINRVRAVHAYQARCQAERPDDLGAHACITDALVRVHGELERCLLAVLTLEGWDRATLTMPEGLRRLREEAVRRR